MLPVSIDHLAAKMRALKERNAGSTILFIGAGASRSAGIPSAGEIQKHLETTEPYSTFIRHAARKDYYSYMACISHGDRKWLFDGYIKNAKINSAHLYAAQLMAAGFIDTVVTTNFDPLILRSLSLFNYYPAVYDLAIIKDLVTNPFDHPAVLFLHGQSHGIWQLNDNNELELPANTIRNAFDKIGINRAWIVCGYSGGDPVFDHLAAIDNFSEGLYWLSHGSEPPQHVRERLLDKHSKGAFVIPDQDADTFFLELKARLIGQNPTFITRPFSHMLSSLGQINPDIVDGKAEDITEVPRQWLDQAVELFEQGKFEEVRKVIANQKSKSEKQHLSQQLSAILVNKNYETVTSIEDSVVAQNEKGLNEQLARIINNWGAAILERAKAMSDETLYREGCAKLQRASEINPNLPQAWGNWGAALLLLANINKDEALYRDSNTKLQRATETKPDYFDAWGNWGRSLHELARLKSDDTLYRESMAKFQRASEIEPRAVVVWINWGLALGDWAQLKNDEGIYHDSFTKFQRATEMKPDNHISWSGWGSVLSELGKLKKEEAFYREAFLKYQRASQINPMDSVLWNNWGWALNHLAQQKNDQDLYRESIAKLQRAIEIKPDNHVALTHWGSALAHLAELKNDEGLFLESIDKFQRAIEIKPDFYQAWRYWGFALSGLAKQRNDKSLYFDSFAKFQRANELKPEYHEAWYDWAKALKDLSVLINDKSLYAEGLERYRSAVVLDPTYSKTVLYPENELNPS
ncbi:MAG: hypothetical protein KA175_09350 [Flavobacteriales bacterium]|nr:hypothetical protein [Flavobacteriales bacterium]MBP6697812.1 hypothetical protein [Flavobacteriales bacterium]